MPDKSSLTTGQASEPNRPHKSLQVRGRCLRTKSLVTGLRAARSPDLASKPVCRREPAGGFDSRPPPRGHLPGHSWLSGRLGGIQPSPGRKNRCGLSRHRMHERPGRFCGACQDPASVASDSSDSRTNAEPSSNPKPWDPPAPREVDQVEAHAGRAHGSSIERIGELGWRREHRPVAREELGERPLRPRKLREPGMAARDHSLHLVERKATRDQ